MASRPCSSCRPPPYSQAEPNPLRRLGGGLGKAMFTPVRKVKNGTALIVICRMDGPSLRIVGKKFPGAVGQATRQQQTFFPVAKILVQVCLQMIIVEAISDDEIAGGPIHFMVCLFTMRVKRFLVPVLVFGAARRDNHGAQGREKGERTGDPSSMCQSRLPCGFRTLTCCAYSGVTSFFLYWNPRHRLKRLSLLSNRAMV